MDYYNLSSIKFKDRAPVTPANLMNVVWDRVTKISRRETKQRERDRDIFRERERERDIFRERERDIYLERERERERNI